MVRQRSKSTTPFTPEIDRQIVDGFLLDQEATLRKLASDGFPKKEVLNRAAKLGITGDFLTRHRLSRSDVSVRNCLNCDETFVSTGPQNRLCNRCRKK